MRVSTLSNLIAWPTRCNASFTASIALTRSRRVFLVLVRPSMCEGKRTPWSHTCVSASSTKCRTCKCLIQSPTPLKLNIPGLGRRLRRGRRPTTTAPSEHASNQPSNIIRLLFWMRIRSNFIASCWSYRPKPTFPSCLSTGRAFDASSSFTMRKPQKRYLLANFWEAQSWTSMRTRWTQVIMHIEGGGTTWFRKARQLPVRRLGKYCKNAHSRCHSVIGGLLRHVRHIHLWKSTWRPNHRRASWKHPTINDRPGLGCWHHHHWQRRQLCSSSTHPGITLAQDCIRVLLCTPNQFVGQGRHRHQLVNYGLSGAHHCLDIEQVNCEVATSFARRHEGDIWVHLGSCPNGRHAMELSSRDASVVVASEIGLQDVHPTLELTRRLPWWSVCTR